MYAYAYADSSVSRHIISKSRISVFVAFLIRFVFFFFFFFQAEDGIRDADVTGVQTCALPILMVEVLSTFYDEIEQALGHKIDRKLVSEMILRLQISYIFLPDAQPAEAVLQRDRKSVV